LAELSAALVRCQGRVEAADVCGRSERLQQAVPGLDYRIERVLVSEPDDRIQNGLIERREVQSLPGETERRSRISMEWRQFVALGIPFI
jgi:hypothetical protein